MRVISKKKIYDYIEDNIQSKMPLVEWYIKIKNTKAQDMNELKKVFNSIDKVKNYTIFDIGGNNYRLITAIHYNSQLCYIREIWRHAEYSKPYNQTKLQRGKL